MPSERSLYTFEVFEPDGTLVADVTPYALNRHFTVRRNRAEKVSFSCRLEDINALCAEIGTDFRQLFAPGRNEMRVKRGNRYLVGAKIDYIRPELNANISTIEVRASGFLDLFRARYLYATDTLTYSATDIGQVAWSFINQTQGHADSSHGVTEGTLQESRDITDTWQPLATSIRDIIVALSERQNSIDFEFTPDKQFNTYYPAIGTEKTELRFSFPGNIKQIALPIDATELVNLAIVRGSGNGDAQVVIETESDSGSISTYKRWEGIEEHPSVSVATTLEEYGREAVRKYGNPTTIPEVVLDGSQEPYLGSYWVGDRVRFDVAAGSAFDALNNQVWRINEIDVSIGDEDQEEIRLLVGYS